MEGKIIQSIQLANPFRYNPVNNHIFKKNKKKKIVLIHVR